MLRVRVRVDTGSEQSKGAADADHRAAALSKNATVAPSRGTAARLPRNARSATVA